ncbi:MAG: MFS transporter [Patescibacteria group bacterium]|nr:MFS transporter [Patescibacteria group bacterium]
MRAIHIKTPYKNPKGRIFSWLTLMYSLGIGLALPIIPNFIKLYVHTDQNVSLFFVALAIVALFSALTSSFVFRRFSRTKILNLSLLMGGLTFVALPFVSNIWELTVIEFVHVWFRIVVWISLSLFVYDYTKKQHLGEAEGTYYTFNNIGFLIGLFAGGYIASRYGFEYTFYLAGAVLMFTLLYVLHRHFVSKHTEIKYQSTKLYNLKSHRNLWANTIEYFKDNDRRKAYLASLGLSMWCCFKYTYIPLYVVYKGFQADLSGLILALSILPLIAMERMMGRYADKHGLRGPVAFGLLLYSFSLFLVYSIDSVMAVLVLMIIASVGTGIIEPLKDMYILKHVENSEEEAFYGVFRTSDSIGALLTPLIGAIAFMYGSYGILFISFSVMYLLMATAFVRRSAG